MTTSAARILPGAAPKGGKQRGFYWFLPRSPISPAFTFPDKYCPEPGGKSADQPANQPTLIWRNTYDYRTYHNHARGHSHQLSWHYRPHRLFRLRRRGIRRRRLPQTGRRAGQKQRPGPARLFHSRLRHPQYRGHQRRGPRPGQRAGGCYPEYYWQGRIWRQWLL